MRSYRVYSASLVALTLALTAGAVAVAAAAGAEVSQYMIVTKQTDLTKNNGLGSSKRAVPQARKPSRAA